MIALLAALATALRLYTAPRTVHPITVDGVADESAWATAPWTDAFVDITGDPAKKPVYATRLKMLWDRDYLYFYVEMEEPNLTAKLTERDSIVWHENDFEIFIDPDGDGENYFEFEFNALNTLFDLFLTKPYSRGAFVLHQWNAEGLKSAVRLKGTLNDPSDRDEGWSLEVAIPATALANGFDSPLKEGAAWRVGFSRVEWLKEEREENWTWGATGEVNMHIPEKWGVVTLGGAPRLSWVRWNAAEESEESLRAKLRTLKSRGGTGVAVDVGAARAEAHRRAARIAKEFGLEYHAWLISLLKGDAPESWYAVNRLGKSAARPEDRAYVTYYATLDPGNPEVAAYLTEVVESLASVPEIDFVQLDYIRYADYELARGLWPKYGVSGAVDYADYCYCTNCLKRYEAVKGEMSFDAFREQTLTALVNRLADAVHAKGKRLSVDVFPASARYARRMVRQNWPKWRADAFFAMNYNVFYDEGLDWIASVTAEEAASIRGSGAALYSGLKVVASRPEGAGYVDPELKGLVGEEVEAAARRALQAGADGVALFGEEL